MNAADGFRAVSLSGRIVVKGHDGRTCELELNEIMLDRYEDPDTRIQLEVDHEPQYVGSGAVQQIASNPVSHLGVRIRLRKYGQPEEGLFRMIFREAASDQPE